MTDRAWKAFERRICHAHGVERKPVTGRQRDHHGADNEPHPLFHLQMKLDKGLPLTVERLVHATATKAAEGNRVGVVVWKRPGRGRPDADAVVMVRLDQWLELHGSVQTEIP